MQHAILASVQAKTDFLSGYERLPLNILAVGRYQRACPEYRIDARLSDFEPLAVNPPIVVKHGRVYHVMDGWGTVKTLQKLGITHAYCRLHRIPYTRAARVFKKLNSGIPVRGWKLLHASLEAKEPKALAIARAVRKYGFTLVFAPSGSRQKTAVADNGLTGVAHLVSIRAELLEPALRMLRALGGKNPPASIRNAYVVHAFARLLADIPIYDVSAAIRILSDRIDIVASWESTHGFGAGARRIALYKALRSAYRKGMA
jgi:hypothetical protein